MTYFSRIVGTGTGIPERSVTNHDLESFVDTSDEWIRTRTGIEARYIGDPTKGESTLTFAEAASRKALEMAEVAANDIELIVLGTVTPDTIMPSTATQVQAR